MSDWVGKQLGNYRLIRLLGEGGFAYVYLGEHVFLRTQSAVKVLQARVTPRDLQGFVEEARNVAQLKHPHIVRVLDFGVDAGTPFLVMEYMEKGTLRERHPRGSQVPVSAVASYIRAIAEALQYAHNRRLIHRDVKPENMLIDACDNILLSDFGIAVAAQSTSSLVTQRQLGTIHYMAPEQVQGKARPASDQYALGIVAYEWLCGERPFTGSIMEVGMQHLFTPPPSLRERLPELPHTVEQVILKALAKEPAQRFSSVQEFAEALEQASSGETLADSVEADISTFVKPARISLPGFDEPLHQHRDGVHTPHPLENSLPPWLIKANADRLRVTPPPVDTPPPSPTPASLWEEVAVVPFPVGTARWAALGKPAMPPPFQPVPPATPVAPVAAATPLPAWTAQWSSYAGPAPIQRQIAQYAFPVAAMTPLPTQEKNPPAFWLVLILLIPGLLLILGGFIYMLFKMLGLTFM